MFDSEGGTKSAMLKASIVVLCTAATVCQAFHVAVPTTSSRLSATAPRHQPTSRTHVAATAAFYRRPRSALGMTAAASGDEEGGKAATLVPETAESASDVPKTEEEKAAEDPSIVAAVAQQERAMNANKKKKRPYTTEEQAYLDKMDSVPTIYKRTEDDFYPSVGYESAFDPSGMAPEDVEYTGDAMFTNDEDQEEILMRVMIVGAGEQEGQFVKNLSEKGSTTLVSGLYTLWDPRVGEISETVAAVDFMNVHELGSANMKDPEKVAKHAAFMAANMLVAVIEEPSYGEDYVPRLKKAALENGLTFVGPTLAAEVAKGEMEAFAQLVQDTRAALAN